VGPVGYSAWLRGGVGVTFSRELCFRPTLLGQREKLPHTGTACRKRTSDGCGLAWEAYMSCILDFPYRVYIDSNRCDSHI
jgi:hypothetical protein